MRIGVLDYRMDHYSYLRAIINKVPSTHYLGVKDLYSLTNRGSKKINSLINKPLINTFDLNNQFNDFGFNRVDLIHLFNGVSYAHSPWVSSFETVLPRLRNIVTRHQGDVIKKIEFKGKNKRAFLAMSGKACKALLPMSHNSALMQRDLLQDIPEEIAESICSKIKVLHPPQELLITDVNQKQFNFDDKLRFMFVGAGFFRKGGREILTVFEKLVREKSYPIELIIISSLYMDHYAAHETEADVIWAKEKIASNLDWITYYSNLPNSEVLGLMKRAHIGLLPTYADTYGYSVLEFQASGCPVITTNIRALPEINNDQVGWLIDVPRNSLGEALYTTESARRELGNRISGGLESIIEQIMLEPKLILKKSQSAFEQIRNNHDPADYGERLTQIYRDALR